MTVMYVNPKGEYATADLMRLLRESDELHDDGRRAVFQMSMRIAYQIRRDSPAILFKVGSPDEFTLLGHEVQAHPYWEGYEGVMFG